MGYVDLGARYTAGRKVQYHSDLPAAMVRIERDDIPAGSYHVTLIDAIKGNTIPLGAVIAE